MSTDPWWPWLRGLLWPVPGVLGVAGMPGVWGVPGPPWPQSGPRSMLATASDIWLKGPSSRGYWPETMPTEVKNDSRKSVEELTYCSCPEERTAQETWRLECPMDSGREAWWSLEIWEEQVWCQHIPQPHQTLSWWRPVSCLLHCQWWPRQPHCTEDSGWHSTCTGQSLGPPTRRVCWRKTMLGECSFYKEIIEMVPTISHVKTTFVSPGTLVQKHPRPFRGMGQNPPNHSISLSLFLHPKT